LAIKEIGKCIFKKKGFILEKISNWQKCTKVKKDNNNIEVIFFQPRIFVTSGLVLLQGFGVMNHSSNDSR
jgi:hypothetical protein